MPNFRLTAALAAAALALVLPATSDALTVGMGDQKLSMFGDARFQQLGIKHARVIVGWDAVQENGLELQRLDAWLVAARTRGIEPLVTFNHSRTRPEHLPTPAEYEAAVRAFRARYPWVTVYAAWNEANHKLQPTYRRPDAAAAFYEILVRNCAGCTIVAADLLDDGNIIRWSRAFRRAARTKPKVWGVHAYGDAQKPKRYLSQSRTARFLRAVPGEVWLTETGGFVYFRTIKGVVAYPYDEARAARAVGETFRVAKLSRRITRLYLYMWQADTAADARWDSAFIAPDGRARPAFGTLQRQMRRLAVPNPRVKPRVRLVSRERRGRRLTVELRTHPAAYGQFRLLVKRGNRQVPARITERRRGRKTTLTIRLRRGGRQKVSIRFRGMDGWASQGVRAFFVRVR